MLKNRHVFRYYQLFCFLLFYVGHVYANDESVSSTSIRQAIEEYRNYSPSYLKKAEASSRSQFNEHYSYSGIKQVANKRAATEILIKAAGNGEAWAQLSLASYLEKSNPAKAMNLYRTLAVKNNCLAQERLSRAYFDYFNNGKKNITTQDKTFSYFWFLVATNNEAGIKENELHAKSYFEHQKNCPQYEFRSGEYTISARCPYKLSCDFKKFYSFLMERDLSEGAIEKIQELASSWEPGAYPETELYKLSYLENTKKNKIQKSKFAKTDIQVYKNEPTAPMRKKPLVTTKSTYVWVPLERSLFSKAQSSQLQPEDLYEKVAKSVWTVLAADNETISQGSAVAVAKNLLLTNCHVVSGYSYIKIKNREQLADVVVKYANYDTDKCILETVNRTLVPVLGIREYSDLRVGELVYTVGSPRGLEASFSQGIVSGLRASKNIKLIQITAPVSSGSSGGGVFDKNGNLIGISTFLLKESQNINFSISVNNFFE